MSTENSKPDFSIPLTSEQPEKHDQKQVQK